METDNVTCKVITPMFSYGANNTKPELRPTELKGVMRYIYRITQQNVCSKELFAKESELFGSTKIPSPIRLQMDFIEPKKNCERLLLHKDVDAKKNRLFNCINIDSTFDIIIGYRKADETNKQLYLDILRLSLYLSGMGKRTRRARGCVCIEEEEKTKEQTMDDVCNLLNSVANYNESYVRDGCCINPKKLSEELRPVIQKICFGKLLTANCSDELNKFLTAVDEASHQTKKNGKANYCDPTGTSSRASSIIVSVAKTTDGYLPIYTYVKAINGCNEIDEDFEVRDKFQKEIEKKTKNGGK